MKINAQAQLENSEATYSSVYGGMEDGGISSTRIYTFVTRKNITLSNIYYQDKPLQLKKGATLCFSASAYEPYNSKIPALTQDTLIIDILDPNPPHQTARMYKSRYIVDFYWVSDWDLLRAFTYKKKAFVASCKTEFDKVNVSYAP